METNEIHRTYHKFYNWLIKTFGSDLYSEWKTQEIVTEKGRKRTFKYRHYNEYELSKRLVGSDVIDKIEKYIKRNCKEIKIVRCDDFMYDTSLLLLIPHPEHGVTIMFIPQGSGIQNHFFLYPGHYEKLMNELKNITENLYEKT